MRNPLLDKTSARLKFLARAPVRAADEADIEAWLTSDHFTHDDELLQALGRQLKLPAYSISALWEYIEGPFLYHVEKTIKAPAEEMFEPAAKLVASESFVGCDRVDFTRLFDVLDWDDFNPPGPMSQLVSDCRPEAERRTAQAVRQMLERWHSRGYRSKSWRPKQRVVDLTERDDRRRRRLAGDRGFDPPRVTDPNRH